MIHKVIAQRIDLLFFLSAGLAAGCGGPTSVATLPVNGKVTVDGKPVTSGQVSFIALDEKIGAGLCTGTISAGGEYKISSDGQPGAPLGNYKVTVTPPMVPPSGGAAAPPPPFNSI